MNTTPDPQPVPSTIDEFDDALAGAVRARDARVRAAALLEAADELRRKREVFRSRFAAGIHAAELHVRDMAAAARPDCAVCHQPADGHPDVCFPPTTRPDDTTGA